MLGVVRGCSFCSAYVFESRAFSSLPIALGELMSGDAADHRQDCGRGHGPGKKTRERHREACEPVRGAAYMDSNREASDPGRRRRSEEHTSELQSRENLV